MIEDDRKYAFGASKEFEEVFPVDWRCIPQGAWVRQSS